ncbi:hypothetical protein CRE_10285 [Caenorhabditis remanei]|uniref:Uncharacterized protein n=1 Tax=Caenorhabditis remanei TaxID=31234 RepID=E3M6A8_CAERE|nr:hypothetical protein CRE_10285 [Caenorhabditis remanei]
MTKQRGRKRKFSECKENMPPKIRIDRTKIVLNEQDWMPAAATEFYNSKHYERLRNELALVDNDIVFFGPFRKLKENSDVNGVELIMLDREQSDLPEMQTFMKCGTGRYSFWRDEPSERNPVVMFLDQHTCPEVTVVGNKVEHAIHHLCMRVSKYQDNTKEIKEAISTILDILGDNAMKDEIARVIRNRKRETIVGIVGPGLLVGELPRGGSRYRVMDDAQNPNIESLLRCLKHVPFPKQQDTVVDIIDSLMGDFTVYNDEGFYGNGLELGHLLFLANHKSVSNQALILLQTAYQLLKRNDFITILKLTLELRDH